MKIVIMVLAIVALLVTYMIYSFKKIRNAPEVEKNAKITDLTDKTFQHQIRTGITLVDFWASWCVPCKMMAPALNEIADEVSSNVKVCKVNVEQYQSLASKYGVRGIPTMLLFSNGKEVDRFVGVKTKDFLLNQIRKTKHQPQHEKITN
jgi:thioredoxin 1